MTEAVAYPASGRHEADLLEQLSEEEGDDGDRDFDEHLHNQLFHDEPLPFGFTRHSPEHQR
ncbi:MAG: hypothetical protein QOG36_1936 [Actinomycetota bacterium]|jgi:hypothetical protein|nr:hypothetical protein [Actinomycetota bacterium]